MLYKKYKLIFLGIIFFYFQCSSPTQTLDDVDPIKSIDFNYLQDDEEIYLATELKNPFNGLSLRYVRLAWHGQTNFSSPGDSFILADSGKSGDILKGDNIFAVSKKLSSITLNPISLSDTNKIYIKVIAHYENGNSFIDSSKFSLGNLWPFFTSFELPETVTRPSESGSAKLINIKVGVDDPNGLDDIQWVGFLSYKNENNELTPLNNGNYVFLDDSGDTLHYGDETANDGIFSGLLQLPYNATTGNLDWKFRVQDRNGAFRDSIKKIEVLP